jgi:hypothetical protein
MSVKRLSALLCASMLTLALAGTAHAQMSESTAIPTPADTAGTPIGNPVYDPNNSRFSPVYQRPPHDYARSHGNAERESSRFNPADDRQQNYLRGLDNGSGRP